MYEKQSRNYGHGSVTDETRFEEDLGERGDSTQQSNKIPLLFLKHKQNVQSQCQFHSLLSGYVGPFSIDKYSRPNDL